MSRLDPRRGLFGLAQTLLLAGCGGVSTGPPGAMHYRHPALTEPSGLVASRRYPGVFWTHNDSGGQADLFAVTAAGTVIARIPVEGAEQRDWEAITVDDAGRLYIGDIGNNRSRRRDLQVYVVPEPDPRRDLSAKVERTVRFRYPDQKAFPAAVRNFDAESLFWTRGVLYLLTKHRGDMQTKLYRFPPAAAGEQVLERVGAPFALGGNRLLFGGRTTDAAITPDGQYLAVLSYHAFFIFERPQEGDAFLSRLVLREPLDQTLYVQCEAIAWAGRDLIISNEQGRIFRIEDPLSRAQGAQPNGPSVP